MPDPSAGGAAPDAYAALVDAIATGAVLLVGAGSSCKAGYPSWSDLLSELAEEARTVDAPAADGVVESNGLLRASSYRAILGDARYQAFLKRVFAPRTPPHQPEHEALVSLPFQFVLTTNYDPVLRSAHQAVKGEDPLWCDGSDRRALADLRQRRRGLHRTYVHLHGSAENPDRIVLCQETYDQRYIHEPAFGSFLEDCLLGQRIVFVGFSLSDEDFNFILRRAAALGRSSEPRHFALLPRPSSGGKEEAEAADLRGKYGIEAIYFDNASGDYRELWQLVSKLHSDVTARLGEAAAFTIYDLIEKAIPDPDARRAAVERLPQVVQQRTTLANATNVGSGGSSLIDEQIDRVFQLVSDGRSEEAIQQYEAIRAREGGTLTPKHKYRLDANIGNAHYAKGEASEASEHYLRAVSHYRESRDARAIEALGYLLGGDHERARRLAEDLCSAEADFPRAWSIWINAQRDDASLAFVKGTVPDSVRRDAEVAFALADLSARTGDLASQVEHARTAVDAEPEWPDALSRLGTAILQQERQHVTFSADQLVIPRHPERLREADEYLTKAITLLKGREPVWRLAGLHFNRSAVRRLLGWDPEATVDVREAFRLNPKEPLIVLAFAMQVESEQDVDSALEALATLEPTAEYISQAQFATALLLSRRKRDGDADRALEILDDMCENLGSTLPSQLRGDVVRLALRIRARLGRAADGPALVEALPSNAVPDYELAMLKGEAYRRAELRDVAREHVINGLRELGDQGSWFERREAAMLAEDCGLYTDAVRLWQSILKVGDTGSDSINLARAAYYANHWRTALDVCTAVRAAGRTTREHLKVEVAIRAESRDTVRAIDLLRSWIADHPRDKQAILQLSMLALHDDRPELAVFESSHLPSVAELSHAGEGAMLVQVLRRGPEPEAALRAAFRLYRRFPDDHDAHMALLSCIFDPSATPVTIERPSSVGENVAVLVGREGEQPRWVYVETEPDPVASRGEYPPSHDFVQAMWGRSSGDTFRHLGHTYRLVRVENGLLRRAHEIAERYEENFPERGMLRRFTAPAAPVPGTSLKEQLGEMYELLEREDRNYQLLESLYRNESLPISAFARFHGRRVFDVVRHLAADPSLGVRADDGRPERWPTALAAIAGATELVLDETSLTAALVLGLLDDLPRLKARLLVPQAVLDDLRHLTLEVARTSGHRATIGIHNGEFFFHELSPDELAREVEQLERVIAFIRDACEVVGGEATIDLAHDARDKLRKVLEQSSIDAVAIAAQRGCPLWTDDLGLQRLVAEIGLGVSPVWTQAVVEASYRAGELSRDRRRRCHAALLAHGYSFTRLSADDVVGVLQVEGWRMERRAVRGLIREISRVALLNPHNQLIAALGLKLAWDQAPTRPAAKRFVLAVLEALGRKRANVLAEFIYHFPGLRHTAWVWSESPVGLAGTERPSARKAVPLEFDPFRDASGRSLKRLLRAWRSRDGELRPETRRQTTPPAGIADSRHRQRP